MRIHELDKDSKILAGSVLGQILIAFAWWLCHQMNDGHRSATAVERPFALNGVVEHKYAAPFSARRDSEDGGMTAL